MPPSRAGERRRARRTRFRKQASHRERTGRHRELSIRKRPGFTRSISVELEPVAVRIRKVDRLTDVVVGKSFEIDGFFSRELQPGPQAGTIRKEHRNVEKPRRFTGWSARASAFGEG